MFPSGRFDITLMPNYPTLPVVMANILHRGANLARLELRVMILRSDAPDADLDSPALRSLSALQLRRPVSSHMPVRFFGKIARTSAVSEIRGILFSLPRDAPQSRAGRAYGSLRVRGLL